MRQWVFRNCRPHKKGRPVTALYYCQDITKITASQVLQRDCDSSTQKARITPITTASSGRVGCAAFSFFLSSTAGRKFSYHARGTKLPLFSHRIPPQFAVNHVTQQGNSTAPWRLAMPGTLLRCIIGILLVVTLRAIARRYRPAGSLWE